MDSATATVTAASVAAVVALGTGVMTYLHNRRTLRVTQEHNQRTINELRVAERRRQLNAALQELLVPLDSQLNAMRAMFKIFATGKPPEFRTLPYLLDPAGYEINGQKVNVTLTESDRKLLEEIIDFEKRVEELLLTKGGLADDPELSQPYVPNPEITDVDPKALSGLGLFAIAIAHFRVFRLAYLGAIKGDVDRYKDFVYPRELNGKVEAAIKKSRDELKTLSVSE